jgi:hypothetical protein
MQNKAQIFKSMQNYVKGCEKVLESAQDCAKLWENMLNAKCKGAF